MGVPAILLIMVSIVWLGGFIYALVDVRKFDRSGTDEYFLAYVLFCIFWPLVLAFEWLAQYYENKK